MNRKVTVFREKLETAHETMKNLKVPENLQNDVKYYLTYTQDTFDNQKEYDEFLALLSPSLKEQISKHIFQSAIMKNPLFNDQTELVQNMLNHLVTKVSPPEDKIIRQNDKGEHFYFIARGDCDVLVNDENGVQKYVGTLKPGSYFGEVSLIKGCRRTASVISKTYSTWAQLDKTAFDNISEMFPSLIESMERRMHDHYKDRWKKFKKRSLRNIDYLSFGISDNVVEQISYILEPITIKENTDLFTTGEFWKTIHIVSEGELNIYVNNNGNETHLETLYTGCTVGSYCALKGEPYTIIARAKTDCNLLKLPIEKLDEFRHKYDELDIIMTEYEKYWEQNGLPYWDYKLSRFRNHSLQPIKKFQSAVKRIIQIVKSYQSTAFADLMDELRAKITNDKMIQKIRRESRGMKNLTPAERNEKLLFHVISKLDNLEEKLSTQETMIKELRSELSIKVEKLKWYEEKIDVNFLK